MRNERLRALLLERGETPGKLAEAVVRSSLVLFWPLTVPMTSFWSIPTSTG